MIVPKARPQCTAADHEKAGTPAAHTATDIQDRYGDALYWAALRNRMDDLDACLAAGADVHANDDDALRVAAANGHVEGVRRLLAAGADVHAHTDAALYWAAANNHVEVVRILLAAGADVHAGTAAALRMASAWGRADTVCLLLAAGAHAHAELARALTAAATFGQVHLVRLLLAAGADPVIQESKTMRHPRGAYVATLVACLDAMSPIQRRALTARLKRQPGMSKKSMLNPGGVAARAPRHTHEWHRLAPRQAATGMS